MGRTGGRHVRRRKKADKFSAPSRTSATAAVVVVLKGAAGLVVHLHPGVVDAGDAPQCVGQPRKPIKPGTGDPRSTAGLRRSRPGGSAHWTAAPARDGLAELERQLGSPAMYIHTPKVEVDTISYVEPQIERQGHVGDRASTPHGELDVKLVGGLPPLDLWRVHLRRSGRGEPSREHDRQTARRRAPRSEKCSATTLAWVLDNYTPSQ
eukprot:scaffold4586_cov103-Isochrysis_galbana.AAC.2